MVGVELTIWVDLMASTLFCGLIGGAVVFTLSVWISWKIGYCGCHAEGGALTLPGRVWILVIQFHKGHKTAAIEIESSLATAVRRFWWLE
jgi:hypothetical protein